MASAGQANFDLINRISEVTMRFMYQLLADLVLTLHAGVAAFVVAGLALIIAGNWRGWHWVNRLWFRLAHLATIAFVAVQS